jgi:hypothetical protein
MVIKNIGAIESTGLKSSEYKLSACFSFGELKACTLNPKKRYRNLLYCGVSRE